MFIDILDVIFNHEIKKDNVILLVIDLDFLTIINKEKLRN
jgi:hypothetical protein